MGFKVPSNPCHSMILRFMSCQTPVSLGFYMAQYDQLLLVHVHVGFHHHLSEHPTWASRLTKHSFLAVTSRKPNTLQASKLAMTSQKVTLHRCRTEKAAAFTDVKYRWETVSFNHKRVKHLDSCWFRKLWGETRVSKSLLQKPASQQELEPLQHVFRAVKSTCQTVRKKNIYIFF